MDFVTELYDLKQIQVNMVDVLESHDSKESYSELEKYESNREERTAYAEWIVWQLNREPSASSLRFKSRIFMFQDDVAETRIKAREDEKMYRILQKTVKFSELATFYCYDSEVEPYEKYKEWICFCEINLLTGQHFNRFMMDFFDNVAQFVLSEPESALEYWKIVMEKGNPPIFTLENIDGALNHMSILGKERAGLLPLFPDVRERIEEAIAEGAFADDVSAANNAYVNLLRREKLAYDIKLDLKDTNDLRCLKASPANFFDSFEGIFDSRMSTQGIKLLEREQQDREYLERIAGILAKNTDPSNQKDTNLFRNPIFCNIIVKTLTLKNKVGAYSDGKFLKNFRKVFASPTLNPIDGNFEKGTFIEGKEALKTMIAYMDDICEMFQVIENDLKKNHENENEANFTGEGLSDFCEWNNLGKVVIYWRDGKYCKDLFSGCEFVVSNKKDVLNSELELRVLYSHGKSLKKRKKALKKLNIKPPRKGTKFPPPEIVLPPYFAKMFEAFLQPLRYWNFIKMRWTELYLAIINSGIVVSVLNDNLPLLRYFEDMEYPEVISETSILASETSFYTGHSRNKESWRTSKVYNITRKNELVGGEVPLIGEYHTSYNYMLKNKEEKGKNQVTVHSLSVLLNPIVRADLHYSKVRHASDFTQKGNSGMLLTTAIRLGAHKVIGFLLSRGLTLKMSVSSGEATTIRWDLLPQARAKENAKKKSLKQEKSSIKSGRLIAGQKSMKFIESARSLIAPQKSFKQISLPEENKELLDIAQDDFASEIESEHSNMIYADEVSMKSNMSGQTKIDIDVDFDAELEAEIGDKQPEIENPAHLRNIKSKMSSGEDFKHMENIDDIEINNDKKVSLVSTFQEDTPLSVAVECVCDDIYHDKRPMSKAQFRKLSKRKRASLKDASNYACLDIEKRQELVEQMLNDGASVLDCNGAAIKASLPVLSIIAKLELGKKRKKQAKLTQRLADVSHINNLTMTPRDYKNLKKSSRKSRTTILKRFSVVEFLPKYRTLPSSSEAILTVNVENDARREYDRKSKDPAFENKRRFASALAGLRTFNRITQKGIEELIAVRNKMGKHKKGGFYASLLIKVFFVHEAAKRQDWDIIRFLCPYEVDHQKSSEIEELYPDCDVYETSVKKVSSETAEILKQVIKLLLKDIKRALSTTTSRAWRGVFFILREYNMTLSRTTMNGFFACLGLCFTRNINLKAGDSVEIEKFLNLRQVKAFLGVIDSGFYNDRVLQNFSITKSKDSTEWSRRLKGLRNKRMDTVAIRQYLFIYVTAENITSVAEYLLPTFTISADKKMLRELINHCISKKECSGMFEHLKAICTQTRVSESIYISLFQDVLEFCMQPDNFDPVNPVHANLAHELLSSKIKPKTVDDCYKFICRLLYYPLIEPDHRYELNQRCVDLSVYFVLDLLCNLIFLRGDIIEENEEKVQLVEAITKQLSQLKSSELWYQGISKFLHESLFIYLQLEWKPSKEVASMRKFVRKKMRWTISHLPNEEFISVSPCY